MRNYLCGLVLLLGLVSPTLSQACENGRTSIFYTNGIDTSEDSALDALRVLERELNNRLSSDIDRRCLDYQLAYNERFIDANGKLVSYANTVLQVLEAAAQRGVDIAANFWTYWYRLNGSTPPEWMAEIQSTAILAATSVFQSDLLVHEFLYNDVLGRGDRLVVVAHSQGNLYVNQAYFTVTALGGADRFGVVAVATPASIVAGGSPNITLQGDIITLVPFSLGSRGLKNSNPTLCPESPLVPIAAMKCHGFVDSYLAGDKTLPMIVDSVAGYVRANNLSESQRISDPSAFEARVPEIAFDGEGNAIAIWDEVDGIWVNRYDRLRGWSGPTRIATDNSGLHSLPIVAVNSGGNAMAVWHQHDGVRNNAWASRYIKDIGWGTPVLIESGSAGGSYNPHVAMDAGGNAIAVWFTIIDCCQNDVWANRYTADVGWGTPVLLETEAGSAANPRVVMDSSGNGIAVWHQNRNGSRILARRYISGSGWDALTLIESRPAGGAWNPWIVSDLNGNATAVWSTFFSAPSHQHIWANQYIANIGWQTAIQIDDGTGGSTAPKVASTATGDSMVVWQQTDGTRYNIWANRYSQGTGWGTPTTIESDSGEAISPQVALDDNGNALAVWQQHDGTRFNIWANRYRAGAGWGTASLVETENSGEATSPQVAVHPGGTAIVVWRQSDGVRYSTWARIFR